MIKKFFNFLWQKAMQLNLQNILTLVDRDSSATLVDLGCDDGHWTLRVAAKIGTNKIFGVDVFPAVLQKARKAGVRVKKSDLNQRLPFRTEEFSVVHTNQVIEHLTNPDFFIAEIFRVLKPGGYLVISTENLSAWFNIFALVMGWSAFSQHTSSRYQLGNPLAIHSGEEMRPGWEHIKVFTTYSLCRLLGAYGFQIEAVKGAGYYPLFGGLAKLLSRLDPRHAHFITIKARKRP